MILWAATSSLTKLGHPARAEAGVEAVADAAALAEVGAVAEEVAVAAEEVAVAAVIVGIAATVAAVEEIAAGSSLR